MPEPGTVRETIYSGPPPEPHPERLVDAPSSELALVEREINGFVAQVFGWIAGALLISAFFASYSDQWDVSSPSLLMGKALLGLTGGVFLLAFAISRKVGTMVPSVAMATLVAYAGLQGVVFGLSYRAAYDAPLAPVYAVMAALFGVLAVGGQDRRLDLTSLRGLALGMALAPALAALLSDLLGMQTIAVLATSVCSWLMLVLVGYHRQFLRDLPSSFDDDSHWRKAAAVGALKVYLDLVTVVLIVIQLRWLQEFFEDDRKAARSERSKKVFVYRKN